MAEQRTCFVVSPIGERDSDIRRHADHIIKRLIVPSLANLNFKIVRVDQSFANSRITDEIVSLIKNSELCIVDSTDYNPNVMYELGRRHETGRPVILLRPMSQNIIFDLKDIKHIDYDLDSVDSVIEVQGLIRGFLEEFERQGFISSESSVNLENIFSSIGRVERRIDDVFSVISQRGPRNAPDGFNISASVTQLVNDLGAERALIYCVQNELVRESEGIFGILEPKISKDLVYLFLARIAGIGSRIAFDRIKNEILPIISQLPLEQIKSVLASYVHAAAIFGVAKENLEFLEKTIKEDVIGRLSDNIDNEDRGFFINQLGRLYNGAGELKKSRDCYDQAMSLNPGELAYIYNAASNADSLSDTKSSIVYADKLKSLYITENPDPDNDHFALMYKIYKKNGQISDAHWCIERIAASNQLLARVIQQE